MIRSALIALGLSACGLSAGAAVPATPGVPHAADCGVQVEYDDQADIIEASDLDGVQPDPVRAAPDADATLGIDVYFSVSRSAGVAPFAPHVTAKGIMDGADPSSDFCP